MDKLRAMSVFKRIVEAGSFGRAADSLGMARGSVTRLIQELEDALDARLIHRSTRSLRLTSKGAIYYGHCVSILAAVDMAEAGFRNTTRGPHGRLRVVLPDSLARRVLLPALPSFHDRHPDIELAMHFGEDRPDMVQDGIDCAIRIGELEDSSLSARRIGRYPYVTAASPAYLARFGTPSHPDALQAHRAVHHAVSGSPPGLTFLADGKPKVVRVPSRLSTDDSEAHLQSGLLGLGIIQVPLLLAIPHMERGELNEVLAEFRPAAPALSAIFSRPNLSPALRVFVDWVDSVCRANGVVAGAADQATPQSHHPG